MGKGIFFIIIGVGILVWTYKWPTKGDMSYVDYRGYVGGAGFIAIGIAYLTGWFS